MKVVLGFFSQPGARWRQLNEDADDNRLWNDIAYHVQADNFWKQLATALCTHPAIVAYNPLNEPHPEKQARIENPASDAASAWFASVRGTAADVNVFNQHVVAAIRSVDPLTPILLDGPFYSSPGGIRFVEPIDAAGVMYAVHFYGDWSYATFRVNQGRYRYPEAMPAGADRTEAWSIQNLQDQMAAVQQWRQEHAVSARRIIVAEFGVDRRVGGAATFLRDTIAMIDAAGHHWAFYAYRSDGSWGGMDYELGTGKLGWDYWQAVERGEDPEAFKHRHDNPLWAIIQDGLHADSLLDAGRQVGDRTPDSLPSWRYD
jgi:hypothetical protein